MQTILVVEDEAEIAKLLVYVLEAEGYNVIQAGNGEQAYLLLQTRHVDLVVSDYLMPKLNGIELFFRMADDPDTRHIPFILTSASSATITGTPFTAVFGKPYSLTRLVESISNALALAPEHS